MKRIHIDENTIYISDLCDYVVMTKNLYIDIDHIHNAIMLNDLKSDYIYHGHNNDLTRYYNHALNNHKIIKRNNKDKMYEYFDIMDVNKTHVLGRIYMPIAHINRIMHHNRRLLKLINDKISNQIINTGYSIKFAHNKVVDKAVSIYFKPFVDGLMNIDAMNELPRILFGHIEHWIIDIFFARFELWIRYNLHKILIDIMCGKGIGQSTDINNDTNDNNNMNNTNGIGNNDTSNVDNIYIEKQSRNIEIPAHYFPCKEDTRKSTGDIFERVYCDEQKMSTSIISISNITNVDVLNTIHIYEILDDMISALPKLIFVIDHDLRSIDIYFSDDDTTLYNESKLPQLFYLFEYKNNTKRNIKLLA